MKKKTTRRNKKPTTKDLSPKDAGAVKGGSISLPYQKVEIEYNK